MKTKLLLVAFSLFTIIAQAQVRSVLSNSKLVNDHGMFKAPIADKIINVNIDKAKALKEAEEEESLGVDIPYKFGKSVKVNYTLSNSGTWFKTDGGRVWKLKIISEGAYSISLIFSRLKLSGQTQLYIYSQDGSMIYGPVTTSSVTKSGKFSSDIIKGDDVVLELYEPEEEFEQSELHLSKVVHGFRDIFTPTLFGGSSSCQDDVSCHANWNAQSNGVAMIILANMERICSGSLLNNTCQDFTPNILTAFHCIDIGNNIENVDPCNDGEFGNGVLTAQEIGNAEDWIFRFQYKRPNCNTGSEPFNFFSFQEATFRAGWFNTDFALVEMNQNPVQGDQNSGIRFLGWNRSNVAPTSGAIIGHPQGDVMKISTYDANAVSNANQIVWGICPPFIVNVSPANTHWTTVINDGALQQGSSGGPLFDQDGDVVGQLHGGTIGCSPTTAHSGRFDVSWNGGGTPQTRLRDWLDPNNSNVMAVNTILTPTITGHSLVCSTSPQFTLNEVPAGATVTWQVSHGRFISPTSGTGTTTAFTVNNPTLGSTGTVTFTITPVCGDPIQVQRTFWIGPPSITYNPPGQNPCSSSPSYSTTPIAGASYHWSVDNPNVWIVSMNGLSSVSVISINPELFTLTLTITVGNCNYTTNFANQLSPGYYCQCFYDPWQCPEQGGGWGLFTVYPNPASNYIDIVIDENEHKSTEFQSYEIVLLDNNGNEKFRTITNDKSRRIDTSSFKSGQYFLHFFYKGNVVQRQIIINR